MELKDKTSIVVRLTVPNKAAADVWDAHLHYTPHLPWRAVQGKRAGLTQTIVRPRAVQMVRKKHTL